MYASFLGISKALHLGILHQPLKGRLFDSLRGKAKAYQVKQVLLAIEKLEGDHDLKK
jgi:hypothetical protein